MIKIFRPMYSQSHPPLFLVTPPVLVVVTLTAKIRGGVKNIFFTFSKKTETTPPPPFLTTSVFSDKDFLDWTRPPPLMKKMVKNGEKNLSIL